MASTDLLRLYHSVRVVVTAAAVAILLITGVVFDWGQGLALALLVGLSLAHSLLERRSAHSRSFDIAILLDTAVAAAGSLVIGLHVVTAMVFAFLMAVVGVLAEGRRWPLFYVVGWFVPVMVGIHVIPHPSMSLALEVILEVVALVLFAGGIWFLIASIMGRLQVAEASRGVMLGKVSHELRNALTGAKGMAEVLGEQLGELEPEEISEMAGMIATESSEAIEIVEDLLVAGRAERGALEVEPEELDLRALVDELLRRRPVEAAVPVAGPGHLAVQADPGRVRQILRNLLSNADRYGGERVEVQLDRRGGTGVLGVADEGPGIPPGEEETIFGSFRRGSGPRHAESVGLGLTVSRELARAMGGDLTYRREEGWTLFELSLPAATLPSRDRDPEPAPA